jgi:hypothetical protein
MSGEMRYLLGPHAPTLSEASISFRLWLDAVNRYGLDGTTRCGARRAGADGKALAGADRERSLRASPNS